MDTRSLYHRVLGKQFSRLPASLQQFHNQPKEARAFGEFEVRRGSGRIRNWLANRMGLPPAAPKVSVTLHVVVEGDRERWIRDFGGLRLESVQWKRDNFLIEAVGPVRLGLRLSADAMGLEFTSRRAWLHVLRLPLCSVPKVSASVRVQDDGSWLVSVRMTDPFGGVLVTYEGLLRNE
jgi:hypothetical protein